MNEKQFGSYEKSGASTLKMGVKIFGYAVLSGVVALMMFFSLNMISNGLFSTPIGYNRCEKGPNGEKIILETVYYDEDHPIGSEKETGDSETRFNETIVGAKNELSQVMIVVFDVTEQILMLAVLYVMCGYYVYREGDRDRNLEKHHDRAPTPWRGLWIGLIAFLPALIPMVLLILGKCGVNAASAQSIYNLLTPCFSPLNNAIAPIAQYTAATMLEAWQLILLLLLPMTTIPVCAVSYTLGHKRVFKKLLKKKRA